MTTKIFSKNTGADFANISDIELNDYNTPNSANDGYYITGGYFVNIRFDDLTDSSLNGQTVSGAVLTFEENGDSGSVESIDVYKLDQSFDESTVTWSTKGTRTLIGQVSYTTTGTGTPTISGSWFDSYIQDVIDGTEPNYGLSLGTTGGYIGLNSSEAGDGGRPSLELTLSSGTTYATGSYSTSSSVLNYVSANYSSAISVLNYISTAYSSASSVYNYASSTISFANSVLNFVSGSYNTQNNIYNYVSGEYSSDFSLGGAAAGAYSSSYQVFNYVSGSYNTQNSIRNYATGSYSTSSSIRNYISNTLSSAFSIYKFITSSYDSSFLVESAINYATGSFSSAFFVRNYVESFYESLFSVYKYATGQFNSSFYVNFDELQISENLPWSHYQDVADDILNGNTPYSEGADIFIRIGRRGILNGTK
jgi:hypothetical protein